MVRDFRRRRPGIGPLLGALAGAAIAAVALRSGSYDAVDRGELFLGVWWVLGLGLAFGLLPRARVPRGVLAAAAALLALVGWTALGALWSESAGRSVAEVARVGGLTGVLVLAACTFDHGSRRAGLAAVTVAAAAICALALASRLAPDVFTSMLRESGFERRRLSYPFEYWNALGAWAAMTVALTLAWSAHARSAWARSAALWGACLAGTVAYLTYSRAALAGTAIAAVAVVALARRRWLAAANAGCALLGAGAVIAAIRAEEAIAEGTGTGGAMSVALAALLVAGGCGLAGLLTARSPLPALRLPRRTAAIAGAACLAVALAAGAIAGPGLASSAWESFRGGEASAVEDPADRLRSLGGERYALWSVAVDAFRHHPLRGTGAGTFEFTWTRDQRGTEYVQDAHSLYLESLAEGGLPAALLVVLAVGGLVALAVRAALREPDPDAAGLLGGSAAALVAFAVLAGVDWLWESTAVAVLALVLAGLATCGPARSARPSWRLRAGGAAAAFALMALQLPPLVGAARVRASQEAAADRRALAALDAASAAVDVAPWAADGYLQRALVLERAGRLEAAAPDARAATEREAANWQLWAVLARIEARRGRIDAARAAFGKARELNPRSLRPATPRTAGRARS
jgi:hypothetical protein